MDLKELSKWLNEPRQVGPGYHFRLGQRWRRIGEPKSLHVPLVYAALEFRCAIERLAFELVFLARDGNFSPEDEKRCRKIGGIIALLVEVEGDLKRHYKMQKFGQIIMKLEKSPHPLAIIDPKKLQDYWSGLSEFCHRQVLPKETWESSNNSWTKKGYELLNDVENYLWEKMAQGRIGRINVDSMPPEIKELFEKFISDEVTEQEVITRLDLMRPVMKMRQKKAMVERI